ncbi:MAG: hypothetical protein ACK419_00560, partial [Pyrinomonadaceae bacterium]
SYDLKNLNTLLESTDFSGVINKYIDFIQSLSNRSFGILSEDANKIIAVNSRGLVDSSLIPNDCIKPWIENVQYYENDIVIRNNKPNIWEFMDHFMNKFRVQIPSQIKILRRQM